MSSSEASGVSEVATGGLWLHFAGVGGSGMSALAWFHAAACRDGKGRATGSDRAFDQGERDEVRRLLVDAGVEIAPQDGSGLSADCDGVVVSTAVEDTVPDVATAKRLGVPILHRSELLARYVASHRTIAVSGTSGKSTVTAMIFAILRDCGLEPSLLTGGALNSLVDEGYAGNAWVGASSGKAGGLLVIEADESDGSLVRYEPWVGVLLNLRLDHKPPAEILEMFRTFAGRCRGPLLVGEDEILDAVAGDGTRFGLGEDCRPRATEIELGARGSSFRIDGVDFRLEHPGLFNVQNAVAAVAAARACGVETADMVAPLAGFRGVFRRMDRIGEARGVEVIDDFAHNPDKIGAALDAVRPRGRRILAFFQPHGFGPTRFLKDALIESFLTHLGPDDRLFLPEIYYAGGTVTRDISSRDLCDAVTAGGVPATFAELRADLPPLIAAEAREGDVVLVMGARDPSLTDFCREILALLGS